MYIFEVKLFSLTFLPEQIFSKAMSLCHSLNRYIFLYFLTVLALVAEFTSEFTTNNGGKKINKIERIYFREL